MRRTAWIFLLILLPSILSAATNKVYIGMPNDKMNTEDVIQKLMIPRKMEIDKVEKQNLDIKVESDIIKDFSLYLRDLDSKSKILYSYETPFGDMLGISSAPEYFEASAMRKAKKQDYHIRIIQTAKPDSLMSDSIPRDRILAPFNFEIVSGGDRVKIRFSGGVIAKLYTLLRDQCGQLFDINLVNDTSATSILVINGKKTGDKNRIVFEGDTGPLFDIGLLSRETEKKEETPLSLSQVHSLNSSRVVMISNHLILRPGAETEMDLTGYRITVSDNTSLLWNAVVSPFTLTNPEPLASVITNTTTNIVTNQMVEFKTNTNSSVEVTVKTNTNHYQPFDITAMAPVNISNIQVEGGSLLTFYFDRYFATNLATNLQFSEITNTLTNIAVTILTEYVTNFPEKVTPIAVTDFSEIIRLEFADGAAKSWNVTANGSFTNAVGIYRGKEPQKLILRNLNTDRSIELSAFVFRTQQSEGGVQPKNPLSRACDSIFTLDGVEVRRDKNEVEDLLDGVTFRLKQETDKPINLSVDYNYQRVETSISNWMASYNQVMTLLYIMTKPELERIPLSDRKEDKLRDGVFSTETSFLALRNRLRSLAQDSYKTDLGRELSLLEQIGVFSKKSGSFSRNSDEWQQIQMGILQLDREKLKSALITKFKAVEQLFASDPNGDLVKTSGAAIAVVSTLKLAIGTGSFIERRLAINDRKTEDNRKQVDNMNRDLADFEVQQRIKYGRMNQAIQSADAQKKWLDGQAR